MGKACANALALAGVEIVISARGRDRLVSPSAVADKDGKDYYLVRVTPEAQTVETPIGVEPLGLGLTAEVSISAGKRSVLSFLLSPLLKESEKAFRER